MEISYLGHSSFRLKSKQACLVTDPYDPQMVGMRYPKVEASIVTVSHDHKDHNQVSLVEGSPMVLSGPGEYEISGVSVVGYPTYHDGKKGAERGLNVIYVIEMEEVVLCHLGDLGHELTEKITSELPDIDVLFIPVGGVYTIYPKQAAHVVHQIAPSIVIPMHYKTKDMNPQVFGELFEVEKFLQEVGWTVEKADKLSVKKYEIREEKKIVVLEKKG